MEYCVNTASQPVKYMITVSKSLPTAGTTTNANLICHCSRCKQARA